ncbi:LIM domain-containing protein 1 [Cynoglossus semilaevis]|uniref:LIM domain-containing protein 1 n=1 Tax=Cynoglossus semilaevis TaxID=244447 RepID=UPI000D6249D0|nr:LIM domain-containing protein 1-like [Cynoglossus semilaevis]
MKSWFHCKHFVFLVWTVLCLCSGICVRCRRAVIGTGRGCRALGLLFHVTCFTCSLCYKQLVGKPFYSASGEIYCEKDFLYSGVYPSPEVCSSCGHLIPDMVLQARGKSYHPSCFRCIVCRESLEGQPFTVDAENRVYCVSDYHRVKAPYCEACRLPILPSEGSSESIRVVSCDRNYHVECYNGEVHLI